MSTTSSSPTASDETNLDPGSEAAARTLVSLDTRSVARAAAVALSVFAVFLLALWSFGVTGHFLFLLLLAWLFAVAMDPGIRWLMKHGRSRGTATAITGLTGILVALLLVVVFGELFFQQASGLVRDLPAVVQSAVTWLNSTFHLHLDASSISSSLNLGASQVSSIAGSLSGGVFSVLGSIAAIVLDLVTVLVFGFYIAAAGPRFLQAIATGLPPKQQRIFVTVADITAQKTGGYVGSKIVLASLSALFHGILFAAIGVPNWLPFALLVGITAQFIPLVGTYIGVLLPVLATAFEAPWKALVIVAFALVYQQIESYVFTPRVSKKTMDVNPAIALAAVFLGAALWGPIGAIIGIPLVAAAVAIAQTFSQRYDLIPELAAETAGATTATSGS